MIAFVTGLPEDSPCVCSAVHQLISLRIPFTGWEEQKLSSALPDDLENYEALIIDSERFRNLTEAERIRMEGYARKGFVHILPAEYSKLSIFECDFRSEVDFHILAAGSGVSRPGMPRLATGKILEGYLRVMEEYLDTSLRSSHLHEYHLHCTMSLLEAESLGVLPAGWSERITNVLDGLERLVTFPADIDEIAAWAFAPLAARRCGNRRLLEKVLTAADTVLNHWSRSDLGLLSMGGREDDPLSFAHRDSPFFGMTRSTNGRRNLHLNEQLHYFGAAFPGLSAVSGNPGFLEETLALMRHIDTVHRDPEDGLLRHASLHGRALGEKWGRGVSHALLGAFYMLKLVPELPEEIRTFALEFLDKTGRGLLRYQTAGGLWRNVIDREDTPEETSCSVLFTWMYAYAVNHGWFPRERYAEMVLRSADALKGKFWRGRGSGNCRGSYPSPDLGYYLRRPLHMYMMPLIAPALLESDRLRSNRGE